MMAVFSPHEHATWPSVRLGLQCSVIPPLTGTRCRYLSWRCLFLEKWLPATYSCLPLRATVQIVLCFLTNGHDFCQCCSPFHMSSNCLLVRSLLVPPTRWISSAGHVMHMGFPWMEMEVWWSWSEGNRGQSWQTPTVVWRKAAIWSSRHTALNSYTALHMTSKSSMLKITCHSPRATLKSFFKVNEVVMEVPKMKLFQKLHISTVLLPGLKPAVNMFIKRFM